MAYNPGSFIPTQLLRFVSFVLLTARDKRTAVGYGNVRFLKGKGRKGQEIAVSEDQVDVVYMFFVFLFRECAYVDGLEAMSKDTDNNVMYNCGWANQRS